MSVITEITTPEKVVQIETQGSTVTTEIYSHVIVTGGPGGGANLAWSASPTGGTVSSDSGTDATLTLATTTNAGLQSPADKTKSDYITVTQPVDLDAIETRVNALDAAVVLKGTWDASAGTFPGTGTAQAGDSWIVSVAGTVNSVSFAVNDRIIAILDNASTTTFASNWFKADYTDQFLSLDAQTGAVTLGAVINTLTNKATPVDGDYTVIMDSAASNASKKLSWANIKATLKTYFDTLYQAVLVSGTNIKTINGSSILGSGNLTISGGGSPSELSPSTITSWQNDYNPASWASSVTHLRLTFDSSFSFLTGLTATTGGHEVTISNVGSYSGGLKGESASSTAANRFSYDVILCPGQSAKYVYDGTTARWKFVSYSEGIPDTFGQEYHQDFYGVPADGTMTSASVGSGAAVASVAAEAGHPGMITISTGTSGSGEAYCYGVWTDIFNFATGQYISFEALVKLPVLSDATNEYRARVGFFNGVGVGITNGAAVFYNNPGYSANWALITRDGGAQTITSTGVAAGTAWTKIRITHYPDRHIEVWINDVITSASNVTANMPTSAGFGAQIFQLAGTTNRQFLVDYISIKQIHSQSRA